MLHMKCMQSIWNTCCCRIYYITPGSVSFYRLSLNVFDCTVTINHSQSCTHKETHTKSDLFRGFVYYTDELAFMIAAETLALLDHCLHCFTKAHNYNLITIYSPLFVCECLCLCVHEYEELDGFWANLRRGCRCSHICGPFLFPGNGME